MPAAILENGCVPNETTAIKIAEAIWLPIYGDQIYESIPFVAQLHNDIWIVEGTSKYEFGGIPHIKIHKKNASIMFVTLWK